MTEEKIGDDFADSIKAALNGFFSSHENLNNFYELMSLLPNGR